MKTKLSYVLFVAILFSLVNSPVGKATDKTEKAAEKQSSVTDNLKDLFVELSRKLVPSVVNIYTTQTIANPYGQGQQAEMYRKFFEQFFGEDMVPNMPQQQMPQRKAQSLGTGFIIDEKEGLILTNYHVIENADEIKIILTEDDKDQDGIDAKVVGGDAEADVAVLRIKTNRKLKAVTFGNSDALQVGEWVMAIGNPFGHGHTVTKGIISAKERIVPLSQFANYLQTDAPINPGNSGGPLINTAGQVIGINTAINAAAQGIGFAIPINMVTRILPDLRSKGVVTRGFIGIAPSDLNRALSKQLKIKKDLKGVLVSEVFENEPAAKAGLKVYDVITEINGKPIQDARQLVNAVSSFAPGTSINVKVFREGKEKELKVVVGKRPSREDMLGQAHPNSKKGNAKQPAINVGMSVEDLDSELRRDLGLPANQQGVVISRVTPGGPAEDAGFQRGDLIMEVDQKPVTSTHTFYEAFKDERSYLVRFRRGGAIIITSLELGKKNGNSTEE